MAILILTVGVLGMASVMASTSRRQLRATSRIEMTAMAESKLEELRAYSMLKAADSVQVTIGGSVTTSMANHSDTIPSPAGRLYIRRWAVVDSTAGTRAATVRIEPLNQTGSLLSSLEVQALLLVVR